MLEYDSIFLYDDWNEAQVMGPLEPSVSCQDNCDYIFDNMHLLFRRVLVVHVIGLRNCVQFTCLGTWQ